MSLLMPKCQMSAFVNTFTENWEWSWCQLVISCHYNKVYATSNDISNTYYYYLKAYQRHIHATCANEANVWLVFHQRCWYLLLSTIFFMLSTIFNMLEKDISNNLFEFIKNDWWRTRAWVTMHVTTPCIHFLGPISIQRCHLTSIGNPIVEIRWW